MSLTNRLMRAALRRAEHRGVVEDQCVLDSDGVIDLRHLEPAAEPESIESLPHVGAPDITPLYHQPRAWWSRTGRSEPVDGGALDDATDVASCPWCGAPATHDLFDRYANRDFYSCADCERMWPEPRDDAHSADPEPRRLT